MEHVREDLDLQRATATLNDLSAKMALVEAEIADAERRLSDETVARDRTTVDALLELVPGQAGPDSLEIVRQRHLTLRAQRERLRSAINDQHCKREVAHRDAGRRLFKTAGRDYVKKAEALQGAVARILTMNGELAEIGRSLYVQGVVDLPIARFPTRPEQAECMPQWQQDLDDLVAALKQFAA